MWAGPRGPWLAGPGPRPGWLGPRRWALATSSPREGGLGGAGTARNRARLRGRGSVQAGPQLGAGGAGQGPGSKVPCSPPSLPLPARCHAASLGVTENSTSVKRPRRSVRPCILGQGLRLSRQHPWKDLLCAGHCHSGRRQRLSAENTGPMGTSVELSLSPHPVPLRSPRGVSLQRSHWGQNRGCLGEGPTARLFLKPSSTKRMLCVTINK
ncbi:uncharacterized protein LOC117094316 isoform X2 [Trachypithecus francoisi]|uniref:uncharacterized protein LOC117094316 isoform X2 n=1 Tax=Trachypithecus francoisi TaxID=54180 RepID=UPI00141AAF1E|nr:uncharacterized protein LOC117094316 isoform X2 [Trachypithecus francoisi]